MLLTASSEDESLDPRDVDENGHSIFEFIDVENTRHLRKNADIRCRRANLHDELLKEKFQHKQNMQAIWLAFGVQTSFGMEPKQPKLSATQKRRIRKRVIDWADTDPRSGCKLPKK